MDGWHWVAASAMAVLLVVLLLLWFDTLREKPGLSNAQAARLPLICAMSVPIAFFVVLLLPLWLGLVLLAVPAIAVVAMALAS